MKSKLIISASDSPPISVRGNFAISFPSLDKQTDVTTLLSHAIRHKVVAFKYDGGSRPGQVRKVRAEQVKVSQGEVVIGGYDLDFDGELKKGYRQYLGSKIKGDIKVL